MTLDEAIKYHESQADIFRTAAAQCDMTDTIKSKMAYNGVKTAETHKQYAEWLKELKEWRKMDDDVFR